MKSAVAAFVAACSRRLAEGGLNGSLSLLITGDEEGPAINGTKKGPRMDEGQRSEVIDGCIVGEPTNPNRLGEMIKIGRRGSMTADIVVQGTQGHVAYPHLADNPISHLIKMLAVLNGRAAGRRHRSLSTI